MRHDLERHRSHRFHAGKIRRILELLLEVERLDARASARLSTPNRGHLDEDVPSANIRVRLCAVGGVSAAHGRRECGVHVHRREGLKTMEMEMTRRRGRKRRQSVKFRGLQVDARCRGSVCSGHACQRRVASRWAYHRHHRGQDQKPGTFVWGMGYGMVLWCCVPYR